MTTKDKWAERWVILIEGGRLIHIVCAGISYGVMALLVFLWVIQYCY